MTASPPFSGGTRGALRCPPALPARFLQRLGLEVGAQAVDDVLQIAVEDAGQVVLGQPDAVVGQAVLREVVGANLLRAVAGADLPASRVALGAAGFVFDTRLPGNRNIGHEFGTALTPAEKADLVAFLETL